VASVSAHRDRPYDICVRYAGDEFIVVLSDAAAKKPNANGLEHATGRRSDRVRGAAGQDAAAGHQRRRGDLPARGDSYEHCSRTADSRMYRDKTRRKRSDRGPGGRGRRRDVARAGQPVRKAI